MKPIIHTFAAVALLTTPSFAGGPTVFADEPAPTYAPAPAAVHDWSGGYVGLSYGKTSADTEFSTGGVFDFEDGSVAGIYGGYLIQRGSFVYGGELAYGKVSDSFIPGGFGDDDEIEFVLDLKARAGFAADRAMFYGVLGYSQSNYIEPGAPDFEIDLDGMAYGIGAEYAVSERFVIGLEYLTRDLSGTSEGITADTNLDSVSLRAGISF